MWEFIAFVLFGFVMMLIGIRIDRDYTANRRTFEYKGQLYRVTKIENRD